MNRSARTALTAAFAFAALLHTAPATAQVADDLPQDTWAERFRWAGEELHYSIEMLGSEAARCAIAIGQPFEHEELGPVVPLDGLAVSVGFFANVYPMHDTALTYVDPTDGLPFNSTKVIDERGNVRTYEVSYGHETFVSRITRIAESSRTMARYIPSDTHDAISWMIDIRSRDMGVGNEYVYHVFDGWKLSRLTARVQDHTEVYTELGIIEVAEVLFTREVLGSFHPLPYVDSLVLPPVYSLTDGPEDLGVGWFSLDDRRIPVGVDIETPIGHVRMLIDRHVPPTR